MEQQTTTAGHCRDDTLICRTDKKYSVKRSDPLSDLPGEYISNWPFKNIEMCWLNKAIII